MLRKIGNGLELAAVMATFAFVLHMLNGIVVSVYDVEAGTAGVLTGLLTVIELSVLVAIADK